MADPRVVIEWFKKADEDLEFAKSVLDVSQYFAQICFHFHQKISDQKSLQPLKLLSQKFND